MASDGSAPLGKTGSTPACCSLECSRPAPTASSTFTAGMFVFGLGLWDKANFIWFLAALAGTLVALFPRETWNRLRQDRLGVLLGLAALLLGAAPFISYNLKNSGQTWRERGSTSPSWRALPWKAPTSPAPTSAARPWRRLTWTQPTWKAPGLPGHGTTKRRAGRAASTLARGAA